MPDDGRLQMLMTSPNPAPLRELVRLVAVLVARERDRAPSDALVSMMIDDVLLNQVVCIWYMRRNIPAHSIAQGRS